MKKMNVLQKNLFKKTHKRMWVFATSFLVFPTLTLSCFGSRGDGLQQRQIQAIEELNSTVEDFGPRLRKINEHSEKLFAAKQKHKLAVLQAKLRVTKALKQIEEEKFAAYFQKLEKTKNELTDEKPEDLKVEEIEQETQKATSFLQRLFSLKDAFFAQVDQFLQERQIVQGNHELSLLGALVQEARINQLSSWIAEIALYVLGFKWFWGMFTGYRSTFVNSADIEIQQLYANFTGRNTILENTTPDLVNSRQKVVSVALAIQQLFDEMSIFSGLISPEESNTIKKKLTEFSLGIAEKVDKLREEELEKIDEQRSVLEMIEKSILSASASLLDNIKKRTPDKLKEYTELMKRGAQMLASLFDNYKTLDRLEHMSKMSFKEASSYPLNFLTTEFGFIEPSTYQEFRLKEFREFRQQALDSMKIIDSRIQIEEQGFEKLLNNFKNPAENSPASKLKDILINGKKLLENFITHKQTPTFKGISQVFGKEIDDLLEPFKAKVAQKVQELKQTTELLKQKQRKILQLKEKIKEQEKEFDEIKKRVLNFKAKEKKLEELIKVAKETLEELGKGV